PNHARECCPLVLGKRQEFRSTLAHDVALESYKVRDAETVEDGKPQQRILQMLPERVSSLDVRACLIVSALSIARLLAFGMHQGIRKRAVKFDLLPAQGCPAWQCCNLGKRTVQLSRRFYQRRALQGPLSCLAPQHRGLLHQAGFRAMMRQQLWPALGNLYE